MDRYICIHGHFYQPPRENPWLESVETQDSAAPFHDWNDRVTSECYAPNSASRVLNARKKITRIVNNYARISYDFGPTLLSWMEENAQRAYRGVLDADRIGMKRFDGHGPAMAQVYNHMIMPLANQRDKITQIRWGIADFVHRFGRQPEGMWLAETAADAETLDLLAKHRMKFVVLAPAQCRRVRPLDENGEWQPMNAQKVDTRVAYRVPLSDGRGIAAFFYDGGVAQAVAFEGLLSSGDNFAERLMDGFRAQQPGPQLVHIATDGESYGHHHRHGEMALSYALERVEAQGAKLTVYGQFLEIAPPRHEAEVHDNTSWSCFHGVERWRSDCGCSSQIAGWDQQWRAPLRRALDWLRDETAALSEELAAVLLKPQAGGENPLWPARNAYISVILDRSPENVAHFADEFLQSRDAASEVALLRLMELQRHAQLMYTSCGWFFDDISGIETVQILAYAGRVLQLASALLGERAAHLEDKFAELLAEAKSNVAPELGGASLFRGRVKKQVVDLEKVCAHYAIRSLFEEDGPANGRTRIFSYDVTRLAHEVHTAGRARFLTGRARVRSRLTHMEDVMDFAVLHFGDQNLSAAVRTLKEQDAETIAAGEQFASAARQAFLLGNLPEVVRLIERALGPSSYSLHSLFEDEQRRIVDLLLGRTLQEIESGLRSIYAQHTSLLHFLEQARMRQPAALRFVSEFVTMENLYQALERDPIRKDEVRGLLRTIAAERLALDAEKLGFLATGRANRALLQVQSAYRMQAAEQNEESSSALERATAVIESLRLLPVDLNLWQAQNLWYQIWQEKSAGIRGQAGTDHDAWEERLRYLGGLMDLAVDELFVEDRAAV